MREFTLYYTSDLHGYLLPTDFLSSKAVPVGLCSMRFPKDGNTLVIDGGDILQGTPLTAWCAKERKPEFIADEMNRMGYDYITLGNHDFGYGRDFCEGYLEHSHAACLCANLTDTQNKLPVLPWTVHTLENGLRIGLIGLTTEYISRWEKPENLQDVFFEPVMDAAREAMAELLKEKPDLVIGLYHGGMEEDLLTKVPRNPGENVGCLLCDELPFDLLLTGHQHLEIPEGNRNGVFVVQPGCNGKHYIRITYKEGKGFYSEWMTPSAPCELSGKRRYLMDSVNAWIDMPVGMLSEPVYPPDRVTMASQGYSVADLINRVQIKATCADLSVTSLPNTVGNLERSVTLRDVLVNYPYANTLVVRRVTGAVLRIALEKCADYFSLSGDGELAVSEEYLLPVPMHFNYDYFYGMEYTLAPFRPKGSRVVSMKFHGLEILPEDTFTLCMNSFRSAGGFGFGFYQDCPVVKELQADVAELLIDALRRYSPVEVPDSHPVHIVIGDEIIERPCI